jgi:hypothetical protein
MVGKSVFEKFLTIAEIPDPDILEKYAREDFGDEFDKLVESKALIYSGELKDIRVFNGDDEYTTEVVRRNGKNMYRSSSGSWVEAENNEIALYRINFEWLVRQVLDAFGVSNNFKPRALLEENIWVFGQQWIEQKKKPIILVRNINNQLAFEHLTRYLQDNHAGRDPALILTLNKNVPLYFHIPGHNVLLKIEDAMVIESENFELNLRTISDKLGGIALKDGFSPDFRSLRFDGVDYSFTTTESEAIRVMATAGRPLSQHAILEGMNSTRNRLRDIFKRGKEVNPAWGTVILLDGKGMYWLDERIPISDDK